MTHLQFSLTFDQPEFRAGHPEVRHLIARITPPPPATARTAPPMDLAIVIDASGSMAGAPLAAAKEATVRLARQLPPTTRLSVVSFANDVVVHADGIQLGGPACSELLDRIDAICTRGTTDLHAGWRAGCELLSTADDAGCRTRHVVVLSDGCANRGIVDPSALASAARTFLEVGISTTCVGIGDGYSPTQVAALAEHGGGECHDAETADEIVEVLMGASLSFAEVVAEDVQLVIDVPPGAVACDRAGGPATFDGRRLVARLGSVRAGIERTVIVRLDLPAAATAAGEIAVTGRITWRESGSHERTAGPSAVAAAVATSHHPDSPTVKDARAVLEAWFPDLVRRVTELNRDHAFAAIEAFWREEFDPIVAYARQHPETEAFALNVERLRHASLRPMRERTRKLSRDMAGKMAFQQRAHYRAPKGDLLSLFHDRNGPDQDGGAR